MGSTVQRLSTVVEGILDLLIEDEEAELYVDEDDSEYLVELKRLKREAHDAGQAE